MNLTNALATMNDMKKLMNGCAVLGIVLFGFASCQKCHTCTAKDEDGVEAYTYPEACGSKKDLAAYAETCQTEYGIYDFTCTCVEE